VRESNQINFEFGKVLTVIDDFPTVLPCLSRALVNFLWERIYLERNKIFSVGRRLPCFDAAFNGHAEHTHNKTNMSREQHIITPEGEFGM